MFMKRIAIYALMLLVALIVSCGRHRLVVHGFVDEPQDSILFDLKDYVLPASEVEFHGTYRPMVKTTGINTNKTANPLTPFSFLWRNR